jgi:uncharacterized protein YndB with AHSA1/START domain
MKHPEPYKPGRAFGGSIDKAGDTWRLVLVRELRHPPARVWEALTEPEHLRAWAPFDADRSLGGVGTAMLTTVGSPTPHVTEAKIIRADAPSALELTWGGNDLKWELAPLGERGTRLTLWHAIPRPYIAMGAAGWHVCLDVLDRALAGEPIGRIVGPDAMQVDGWHHLLGAYVKQLGVKQNN